MPRIIAFDWTSRALVSGYKRCTRRGWQDSTAATYRAGDLVPCYDKSPRQRGQLIATVKLQTAPQKEYPGDLPDADYLEEGFGYLRRYPGASEDERAQSRRLTSDDHWFGWKTAAGSIWVVRFDPVSITPAGIALLSDLELRELAGRLGVRGWRHIPMGALRPIVGALAGQPGRIAAAPRPAEGTQ